MGVKDPEALMPIARPILAVLIATIALVGCAQGDPSASPAIGRSVPATIALRTQAPEPAGTPQPCMAALISGTLVRDAPTGIAIRDARGLVHQVVWPFGYAARDDGGRLVVLDASGSVVAHEGDRVSIAGGETGTDGTWLACGGTTILTP
jgi:hypothetical protein